MEANPSSVSRESLREYREFGVNRISMGVQSSNLALLASENRGYQNPSVVERAVRALQDKGHVYTQDGARWFRSTAFGDEKDRVVQRENGQYTYFASDIAYHLNKFERGFDVAIDVWGADHHGYVARVEGAISAPGPGPARSGTSQT